MRELQRSPIVWCRLQNTSTGEGKPTCLNAFTKHTDYW